MMVSSEALHQSPSITPAARNPEAISMAPDPARRTMRQGERRGLRVEACAEVLMANKIDQGQADGTLARKEDGRSVRGSDTSATYEDIGVSRQRVSEWRDVREAWPAP